MPELPRAPSQRRFRVMTQGSERMDAIVDVAWGVLGAAFAFLLVLLLGSLQVSFAGGSQHLLLEHRPGGNLVGQRAFAGAFLTTVIVVTHGLRRSHYPLPWYATALLVALFALLVWTGTLRSASAGTAFRRQGYALLPLFPAAALATSALTLPPTPARWRATTWGALTALLLALGPSIGAAASLVAFLVWIAWTLMQPAAPRDAGEQG